MSAGLIFLCGWWLAGLAAKLTRRAIGKSRTDPLVAGFIGSLVRSLILLMAGVSALAKLQINITSLVAALGAAGLTASFALQGSLGNFVSGVQIIFTKPFKRAITSPSAAMRVPSSALRYCTLFWRPLTIKR